MEEARAVIKLKDGNKLVIKSNIFSNENELDIDDLLKIDIANLAAEIVTFPVVLNQLGLLLAEQNGIVNEAKFALEVLAAQTKEKIRKHEEDEDDEDEETSSKKRRTTTRKKLSNDEVDSRLLLDPVYKIKRKNYYELVKNQEIINSAYWAAKSKDDKLNKLSMSLKEGDVYDALITTQLEQINYVNIRVVKPK